jgi:hypothetical protein
LAAVVRDLVNRAHPAAAAVTASRVGLVSSVRERTAAAQYRGVLAAVAAPEVWDQFPSLARRMRRAARASPAAFQEHHKRTLRVVALADMLATLAKLALALAQAESTQETVLQVALVATASPTAEAEVAVAVGIRTVAPTTAVRVDQAS